MYKIIGGLRTRTFRVLWMLEELGVAYEHIASAAHSDEVKAHNAAGKVPVLLDGDDSVTDSTAIMQYLADKHGAFTYPAGTIERAKQDAFTQFALDEMDAVLWVATRHALYLPEDKRVDGLRPTCEWEFERSQNELMRRMGEGPFLMGDQMTVPDIIATHCGNWAIGAKFPVTNPDFKAYLARMRDRDAFSRARAL